MSKSGKKLTKYQSTKFKLLETLLFYMNKHRQLPHRLLITLLYRQTKPLTFVGPRVWLPDQGVYFLKENKEYSMTKLLYMEGFDVVSCDAQVVKLDEHEGKQVVVLDQTCFYAKGGGQDFDQGIIASDSIEFTVEAVFFIDSEVKHIGECKKGSFRVGDAVHCRVDEHRRQINTKLHSAGHVLDMAVRQAGYDWIPGKGAHYPHMSFVEYSGTFDIDKKQEFMMAIQAAVDALVAKGSTNTIQFMTPEEMTKTGAFVPGNLPKNKPSRVVFYDDFAVPCGGTHVKDISAIGTITVTNIKRKDGNIRVSYAIG